MKSYSLSRVAQYARYHYVSNSKVYLSTILTMVALPTLFGIMSRSVETVSAICMAIYMLGGLAFALCTTMPLRMHGTKIMEMAFPVSTEECFTTMVFNLAVVFPIAVAVVSVINLLLVYPFSYNESLGYYLSDLLLNYSQWESYVVVQTICSASLLINLMARRNLFVAYLGAFVGVIFFLGMLGNLGWELLIRYGDELNNIEVMTLPEPLAIMIICSVPVIFYALSYVALRKRQIRW